MSFIKDFSSLNVNEAFKTLFPTVNEEGKIVFEKGASLASEENERKVLDIFKQHIHSHQASPTAASISENPNLSLVDRRQWFALIEQVEKMANTSAFCKELLNTIQDLVLGRIFSDEEVGKPVDTFISYKEIKNSPYLQNALLGEYSEGYKGIITADAAEISEYLENRESLEKFTDLLKLRSLYEIAGFLGDDQGKQRALSLIGQQIQSLDLENVCALLPQIEPYEIQRLLEDRISRLAPKSPADAILIFFQRLHIKLGDFSNEIRSLSFIKSGISPRVLGQIVKLFPNVDTISLEKCKIKDANFPSFLEHLEKLTRLRSLNISLNEIGFISARLLANRLVNLEKLDIASNEIGPEGAEAIATLPKLEVLDISTNQIRNKGLQALSHSKSLEVLIAPQNYITDEVGTGFSFPENLHTLDISLNYIKDKGLEGLADKLVHLECLSIFSSEIEDEGIIALVDKLPNLQKLDISSNYIEDEGATELSKLKKLRALDISRNSVTNKGAKALNGMETLEELDVGYNPIKDRALLESIRSSKKRWSGLYKM